jgi:hypothetical protein
MFLKLMGVEGLAGAEHEEGGAEADDALHAMNCLATPSTLRAVKKPGVARWWFVFTDDYAGDEMVEWLSCHDEIKGCTKNEFQVHEKFH